MSTLTGHYMITQRAVAELNTACDTHPLGTNVESARLPGFVINRDILDTVQIGHWADYGQAHHFMRRFDGQSPLQAYNDGVEWIRSNALKASQLMSIRLKKYMHDKPASGIRSSTASLTCDLPGVSSNVNSVAQGEKVFGGDRFTTSSGTQVQQRVNWQTFGNAIHAMQDSFANGHVVREAAKGPRRPGDIEHVKLYAGDEKTDHAHFDELWKNKETGEFTSTGRLAINASKEIIKMVITTAQINHSLKTQPTKLHGWESFKGTWLTKSELLSAKRDFVIDFVNRYKTGVQLGASNLKTFNMQEEEMANALINEVGLDMKTVEAIFRRLNDHFNSDADDIAHLYLLKLRKKAGAFENALKSNPALNKLLSAILDQGWTTEEEKANIKYLQKLWNKI